MELPNRYAIEEQHIARLETLSGRLAGELRRLLGSPPSAGNVPPAFWQYLKNQVHSEVLILLMLVYRQSAEYHGMGATQAEMSSRNWGMGRANDVAEWFTNNSQDILATASDRWHGRREAAEAIPVTVPEPLPMPQRLPGRLPIPTPAEIDELMEIIFGTDRIERVVINETTQAQTAGGEDGIEATVGLSDEDTWFTERDSRVCPVCRPLHGTPRSVWKAVFDSGPPAHPGCRCWIEYANVVS